MKPLRIAVDIGGTFVDAIAFNPENGELWLEKASTTPGRPSQGVLDALLKLKVDLAKADVLVHGTTLGLNAILERKGASTGIITNLGFRDIFEIGRGDVPTEHMYNFRYQKPRPLVRRRKTAGVPCRIDVLGNELVPLDEEALVREARRLIEEEDVRSLAVCFLHSYKVPDHERRAAEVLKQEFPQIPVSISSDIAREYREFERTSTTVMEAYIRPIFEAYVDELRAALTDEGFSGRFFIMRSSGGAMTAGMAKTTPLHTVLSGPAGGIVGAGQVARSGGIDRLLSLDFGGTSLDACLVEKGLPGLMHEAQLEQYPVLIPIFDIRCIGAGGGSIAWLEGSLLKVGPKSAGADPGPIAYGRGGTEPTTTDAALALGYLDPERFLKGEMSLDLEASRRGLESKIAKPLGIDLVQAAAGIFDVMIARTVGAIREITVERGHDPREFSLLAFGGAGPMLSLQLAREMGIPQTIIPNAPSAFSAWGMLMSDLSAEFSRTDISLLEERQPAELEAIFQALEGEARDSLEQQSVPASRQLLLRSLELRYLGQEHALQVPIQGLPPFTKIRSQFEELHMGRYGHTTQDPIQTVNLRVRGIGVMDKPEMPRYEMGPASAEGALRGHRKAYCFARGKMVDFAVYERDLLQAGNQLAGPAIIDEGTSTTVLFSDQSLRVDEFGQLVIRQKGES